MCELTLELTQIVCWILRLRQNNNRAPHAGEFEYQQGDTALRGQFQLKKFAGAFVVLAAKVKGQTLSMMVKMTFMIEKFQTEIFEL